MNTEKQRAQGEAVPASNDLFQQLLQQPFVPTAEPEPAPVKSALTRLKEELDRQQEVYTKRLKDEWAGWAVFDEAELSQLDVCPVCLGTDAACPRRQRRRGGLSTMW